MTEQLAVRITGNGKKLGSGVFYHPAKSKWCYVYTCAHVLAPVHDWEVAWETEGKEYKIELSAEAACISEPEDVAVLRFADPVGLPDTAGFAFGDAEAKEQLWGYGYPVCMDHEELAFDREILRAQVKAVARDGRQIQLRIEAANLNQADRDSELQGFSGTGLFKREEETGRVFLCGLFRNGQNSAARNIAYAVPAQVLAQVLGQYQLEQPENAGKELKDGAGGVMQSILPAERGGAGMDRAACEEYIALKVKEAEKSAGNEADKRWEEILHSAAFDKISRDRQHLVWDKYLQKLYTADRQEEFEKTVRQFRERYPDEEPSFLLSRQADMCWQRGQYEEADRLAQKALAQEPGNDRYAVQAVLTEAFADQESSWEEIKSRLVYPDGTLNLATEKVEILEYAERVLEVVAIRRFQKGKEGLQYALQVYGRRKEKEFEEDLANCYYLAALEEMTTPEGKLDMHKKNAEYLNLSRKYYQSVFDRADKQERRGLMRRQGGNFFRCLNLLNDVTAMRHIYEEVREACPEDVELVKMMNHAATQWGRYDEEETKNLSDTTKKLLQAQSSINDAEHKYRDGFLEEAYLLYHRAGTLFEELEGQTEEAVIARKDIYVPLMNVYYFLTVYYRENYREKFEKCYQKYCACDVSETEKQNMQLFRRELQGDLAGAEKGFAEMAEREDTLEAYNQLLHFYSRQNNREAMRRLYEYMVSRKRYLIEEDEEYFYRNYIGFYLYQCANLPQAMEGFLKYGSKIQDVQAREFLEMQLRNSSGDFGEMERFLALNERLYKEQWYSEIRCQGTKALYHLHNGQYAQAMADYEGCWNSRDGIVPLAQNMILRVNQKIPPIGGNSVFNLVHLQEILQKGQYVPRHPGGRAEKITESLKQGQIIADAWALYILACKGHLELLKGFSKVFVTYNTHTWLLQELLAAENEQIRQILAAFWQWDNIELRCPGLETQLHFRKNLRGGWIEEHANICLANELRVPLVIGRYLQDVDMGDCWKYLIGVEELEAYMRKRTD